VLIRAASGLFYAGSRGALRSRPARKPRSAELGRASSIRSPLLGSKLHPVPPAGGAARAFETSPTSTPIPRRAEAARHWTGEVTGCASQRFRRELRDLPRLRAPLERFFPAAFFFFLERALARAAGLRLDFARGFFAGFGLDAGGAAGAPGRSVTIISSSVSSRSPSFSPPSSSSSCGYSFSSPLSCSQAIVPPLVGRLSVRPTSPLRPRRLINGISSLCQACAAQRLLARLGHPFGRVKPHIHEKSCCRDALLKAA
jgi:hypothetical protein